jgi:hypothetical protein
VPDKGLCQIRDRAELQLRVRNCSKLRFFGHYMMVSMSAYLLRIHGNVSVVGKII